MIVDEFFGLFFLVFFFFFFSLSSPLFLAVFIGYGCQGMCSKLIFEFGSSCIVVRWIIFFFLRVVGFEISAFFWVFWFFYGFFSFLFFSPFKPNLLRMMNDFKSNIIRVGRQCIFFVGHIVIINPQSISRCKVYKQVSSCVITRFMLAARPIYRWRLIACSLRALFISSTKRVILSSSLIICILRPSTNAVNFRPIKITLSNFEARVQRSSRSTNLPFPTEKIFIPYRSRIIHRR